MTQMKRTEYGYVCPDEEKIDRNLDAWLKKLKEAIQEDKNNE